MSELSSNCNLTFEELCPSESSFCSDQVFCMTEHDSLAIHVSQWTVISHCAVGVTYSCTGVRATSSVFIFGQMDKLSVDCSKSSCMKFNIKG